MSDERYTLDEAARVLDRRECALRGHSFDILAAEGEPVLLTCTRCGEAFDVVMRPRCDG